MKSKKIGLLTPTLQSGGAERVLSIMSTLLSQLGYDVYFFLYDTENISYSYSGTLIDLKSTVGTNIISKVIKRISRIIKISYYKYKYDLDAVISFLYSANVVNYCSIGRAEKILSCRGYGDYIENGKKYSKMINRIDSLIVQTERMKSDFINDFNADVSKIDVLYNPFNIELIIEKSKEEIEEDIQVFIDTHKTICTVGSFKRDKGYWHLIKSFIKVKQSVKNAGLIFIGHRGEMEKEIRDMAEASGFKDDILFLGYQENPFKYISKCDLYVCSSIYEGFPNALVEAMVCGTAVLSTDCKTGPREILMESIDYKKIEDVFFADYGVLVPKLNDEPDFNVKKFEEEEYIISNGVIHLLNNDNTLKKYSVAGERRSMDFSIKVFEDAFTSIIGI